MGLREILGLPPKSKSSKGAKGQTPTIEDRGPWDKAVENHDLVIKDQRHALLSADDKKALQEAWTKANVLSGHNRFNEASEMLRTALADCARAMVGAATALQTYDTAMRDCAGMIDEAALLGVPEKDVSTLRKGQERVRGLRATDLPEAAKQAALLADALRKHPKITAARQARDKVLSERSGLETEIGEALKVPPETKPAATALRQLAHAAKLIGFCVGSLDYLGAVAQMKICRDAVDVLTREGSAIAEAVKLREEVMKARKKLDAKVEEARGVYATSPEGEKLVTAFKTADDNFHRAVKEKDYDWAKTELTWLEQSAVRVIEIKAEATRDIKAREAPAKLRSEVRDGFGKMNDFAAVTKQMKDLRTQLGTDWKALCTAIDDRKYDQAVKLGTAMKLAQAEYLKLGGESTALLQERDRLVDAWAKTLLPRIEELEKLAPRAEPLVEAIAEVGRVRDQASDAYDVHDYTLFAKACDDLDKALTKAEALAKKDREMAKAALKASKAFKTVGKEARKITAAATATPEFREAQDKVIRLIAEAETAIKACATDAPARVTALEEAVKEAEKLLTANNEKVEEKKKDVLEKLKAGFKLINEALVITEACLPHSAELNTLLSDGKEASNALFKKKRYDAALEAFQAIEGRIGDAAKGEAKWKEALEKTKKEVTEGRKTRAKALEDALDWDPVTTEIFNLQRELRGDNVNFERNFKAGAWSVAAELFAAIEKNLDKLLLLEPQMKEIIADRKAAKAGEKRDKAEATTASNEKVNTPTCLDLKGRLTTALAVADRTGGAGEWKAARAAWDEVARLLVEWRVQFPLDQSAAPVETAEINRRWTAMKTDYDTAATITAVPKTLQPLVNAYWKERAAFFRAYDGRDWAGALKLIAKLETASADLAAHKQENTDALVTAGPKSDQAKTTITTTTTEDLKKMPVKDRVALLDELRGKGTALTKEEKKAQRRIYETMTYDEEFKKVDEQRRGQLIEELGQDKEVTGARKGWAGMSVEDRMKVLAKVLAAECRIYNVPAPEIRLFNVPPGDEGFFSGSNGTLNLNTHPESGFSDYKEALDTVLHENMHNMQYVLIQRLEEGILQPGDAEYEQALLFATNLGPMGYVPPSENKEVEGDENLKNAYEHQPAEMHAWDTGDGVSRGIIEGSKKPGKNVTL